MKSWAWKLIAQQVKWKVIAQSGGCIKSGRENLNLFEMRAVRLQKVDGQKFNRSTLLAKRPLFYLGVHFDEQKRSV